MKFIGSKNSSLGSKIIRCVTGSKTSHFLIVFDNKLVLHSTFFRGLNLAWFNTWKKKNDIIWEIDLPLSLEKQEELYVSLLNEAGDKNYDYLAFVYWPLALFKHKILGYTIATKNPWGNSNALLCTGVYALLPKWLVGEVDESQLEMTSPDKLGQIILERLAKNREELCP